MIRGIQNIKVIILVVISSFLISCQTSNDDFLKDYYKNLGNIEIVESFNEFPFINLYGEKIKISYVSKNEFEKQLLDSRIHIFNLKNDSIIRINEHTSKYYKRISFDSLLLKKQNKYLVDGIEETLTLYDKKKCPIVYYLVDVSDDIILIRAFFQKSPMSFILTKDFKFIKQLPFETIYNQNDNILFSTRVTDAFLNEIDFFGVNEGEIVKLYSYSTKDKNEPKIIAPFFNEQGVLYTICYNKGIGHYAKLDYQELLE